MARLDPAVVARNVERVRAQIAGAAGRAGRQPGEVELLAAVKYLDVAELGALAAAGISLLGENRAQALQEKAAAWPGFRWHFIGQLQSRKVKAVLPHAELIHSVASGSALEQLARHATPDTRILLEVNVAGEDSKAGINPSELAGYLERATVQVVGLMTMPPHTDDPEANRPHFAALRTLAEAHGLTVLSMGTSQDFAVAVEEGSTLVRVGSALWAA